MPTLQSGPCIFQLSDRRRANSPILLLVLFLGGGWAAIATGSEPKPVWLVCVPFAMLMVIWAVLALTHSVDVFADRVERHLLFRTTSLSFAEIREIFLINGGRKAKFKGKTATVMLQLDVSETPSAVAYVVGRTSPVILDRMRSVLVSGATLSLGDLRCTLEGVIAHDSATVRWNDIVKVQPRPLDSLFVESTPASRSFLLGPNVPNLHVFEQLVVAMQDPRVTVAPPPKTEAHESLGKLVGTLGIPLRAAMIQSLIFPLVGFVVFGVGFWVWETKKLGLEDSMLGFLLVGSATAVVLATLGLTRTKELKVHECGVFGNAGMLLNSTPTALFWEEIDHIRVKQVDEIADANYQGRRVTCALMSRDTTLTSDGLSPDSGSLIDFITENVVPRLVDNAGLQIGTVGEAKVGPCVVTATELRFGRRSVPLDQLDRPRHAEGTVHLCRRGDEGTLVSFDDGATDALVLLALIEKSLA